MPRGVKRALSSCCECDDPVAGPSPCDCETSSPPGKRRRVEATVSDDSLLDDLFAFNESERPLDDEGNREDETDLDDGSEYDADGSEPDGSEPDADGSDSDADGSESEDNRSAKNCGSNYGGNMSNRNERGKRKGLRPVIIDGSNVAMGHTNGRYFSCKGLKICADYFLERKHRIYVIVPHFRQCIGQARDQHILKDLFQKRHLYFTPSRTVDGRLEVPYDDRYIVQLAAATGGVIVSSDRYRDLLKENPRWADTIKNRLLMFTWVDDILFFPQDPFGKHGPSLDELLRF